MAGNRGQGEEPPSGERHVIPRALLDAEDRARALRKAGRLEEAADLGRKLNSAYYALYDQQDYPAELCHPPMDAWAAFAKDCLQQAQLAASSAHDGPAPASPAAGGPEEPQGMLGRILNFFGRSAAPKEAAPAGAVHGAASREWSSHGDGASAPAPLPPQGDLRQPLPLSDPLRAAASMLCRQGEPKGRGLDSGEGERHVGAPSSAPRNVGPPRGLVELEPIELPAAHFAAVPSPDGRLWALCEGSKAGALGGGPPCGPFRTLLWNPQRREAVAILDEENRRLVGSLRFSPDGRFLLADRVSDMELYSVPEGRRLASWPTSVPFPSIEFFMETGPLLIVGSARGLVAVHVLDDLPRSYLLKAHMEYAGALVADRGRHLITHSSWQNEIKLWELATGRLLKILPMHGAWIAASPTASWVACSTEDREGPRRVEVRSLPDGRVLSTMGPFAPPLSLFAAAEGRVLVVGDKHGSLSLFNPMDGSALAPPFEAQGTEGSHRLRSRDDGRTLHAVIGGQATVRRYSLTP